MIHGRGLRIILDDELQRVGFHVTRVVDAVDSEQAAEKALELVVHDSRSQPAPGYPPPMLNEENAGVAGMPGGGMGGMY